MSVTEDGIDTFYILHNGATIIGLFTSEKEALANVDTDVTTVSTIPVVALNTRLQLWDYEPPSPALADYQISGDNVAYAELAKTYTPSRLRPTAVQDELSPEALEELAALAGLAEDGEPDLNSVIRSIDPRGPQPVSAAPPGGFTAGERSTDPMAEGL